MRQIVWSSLFVTAMLVAPIARAQDSSATVEALFNEGKRLKDQGNFSEACPKFLASYNLDPKRLGTLLNLADCYEKNNQLASAWARFIEARTAAQRANQEERVKYASDHAAALEPKLSKLAVNAKAQPGLVVTLDGVTVDPGAYGVSLASDAGVHKIAARAPDKQPWTGEVKVGSGDKKSIDVPTLEDAPAQTTSTSTSNSIASPRSDTVGAAKPGGGMSGRAITGLVLASVGVVGVGVGVVFGVTALGKKSDSAAFCGLNGRGPNDCTTPGVALRSDAMSAGTMSTVFIAAGGVATVAGLVVFFTAPKSTVTVGFDGRQVNVGGTF